MDGTTIVLTLITALIALGIGYFFACVFAKLAEEKGYEGSSYFWYVFFFGTVGMLIVATLPNRLQEEKMDRILNLLQESKNREQMQPPQVAPREQSSVPEKKERVVSADAVSAPIVNGDKVCPKCGTSQKADRCVCWTCGQKFSN